MNKDITFLAKSSDPSRSYKVHFAYDGNKATITCDCDAGLFGKLCKHKTKILSGDESILLDQCQSEFLQNIKNLVDQSGSCELLQGIQKKEKEIEKLKKYVSKAKKKLEQAMKNGL